MSSQSSIDARKTALEDSRWAFKALLRFLGTIFGLVGMSLFAAAVSYTNNNFVNTMGNGDWADGLALAPIVLSLLYNPIALIMNLLFRKSRLIHPGISLVLDMLVWGMSVPALVFAIVSGIFWYWTPAIASNDGSIDCTFFFNYWSQECNPVAYQIGKLEIAGLIFLFFLLLIHVTLFTFSCIDLQRRKLAVVVEDEGFDMQYRKDVESRSQGS